MRQEIIESIYRRREQIKEAITAGQDGGGMTVPSDSYNPPADPMPISRPFDDPYYDPYDDPYEDPARPSVRDREKKRRRDDLRKLRGKQRRRIPINPYTAPPDAIPPYDDGDPSTDPTFEDLFPFLAPYLKSPYSPGY